MRCTVLSDECVAFIRSSLGVGDEVEYADPGVSI